MSPNTLDELLTVVPGLRRARRLNADMLRLLLARDKRQCTWCGRDVKPPRHSWCSADCVTAFERRCGNAAYHVEKRDKGICQICGRDTEKCERIWRLLERGLRNLRLSHGQIEEQYADVKSLLGYGRGRWREVDHDPPVSEGGGLCPPEQLRLLCGLCHAEVTRHLAGKRAQKGTA